MCLKPLDLMRNMRRLALAAVVVAIAGCGSTVPTASSGPGQSSATGVEQGLGEGTALGPEPETSVVSGGDDDVASDVGGAPESGVPGSEVRPDQGGSTARPGGPIPAAPGSRGVTDTTIRLGFQVDDFAKANAVSGSLGGTDAFGDGEVQKKLQAVVDYVNAQGGIAGRKVEPVWHYEDATSVTSATGRQREAQRACATWTEDNAVFAFGGGDVDPAMRACAVRNKTPMIVLDHTVYPSKKMFDSFAPYWYAPHLMVADHRERALAKTLLADGFFPKGAKVGLLIEDSAGIRAGVDAGMKPVLKAAGVDVAAEAVYPDPIESPWSTYVLRFQSAGVTHVVMSTTAYLWAPSLFMMRAAESQGFRPRWGLGSDQAPNLLGSMGAPPEQLAKAQGMGWIPFLDEGPTKLASPQEALCVQILTKAGFASGPGDGGFCEFPFFMKAALDRAEVISPEGLARAVGGLGTAYVSTMTVNGSTSFAPGKHDGPATMRSIAFDQRCGQDGVSCFKYTSAPRPIPG
jgi:ABC-type branched-subunit amino acid transport system substrate-binding protein